jgi:hypothetical protein
MGRVQPAPEDDVAQYTWPTREEWAAKAEHSVRTSCYTSQRVSDFPSEWLTFDQLMEARRLVASIVKATRPAINREARAARADADEERLRIVLGARAQLNDGNKYSLALYREAGRLAQAWTNIAGAARTAGTDGPEADRLNSLAVEMLANRDTAAKADLAAAIEREVAKRNSDEGWAAELERRARIDAGPVITRYPN